MKFLLFLSLFAASSVQAETEIWKMGDRFFELTRDQKTNALISKNCVSNNNCSASKFIKKVSFKKLQPSLFSGGKNPGAVLCHESKDADIIFLKDLKGNDNSFCLFNDKSMVSASSIEIAAKKNDEAKNAK